MIARCINCGGNQWSWPFKSYASKFGVIFEICLGCGNRRKWVRG